MTQRLVHVAHPTGNSNVRHLVAALDQAGLLGALHTTVGLAADRELPRWLPAAVGREVERRRFPVPAARLALHPQREVARLVAQRVPGARHLTTRQGPLGIDAVGRQFGRSVRAHLARCPGHWFWGYEDFALEVLESAQRPARSVLELPYAHWSTAHALLAEAAADRPAWRRGAAVLYDGGHKRARKERELEAADLIAVPSAQVLESLPPALRPKAVWLPYGCSVVPAPARRTWSPPLRVLFVGRLTLDKGLPYLIDAWRGLQDEPIEWTVIGKRPLHVPEELDAFLGSVRYLGSVPQHVVLREMDRHHVFVLPSLVEGRSLAALEAVARGLVPVVTRGSGIDDLVGAESGYVVPSRAGEPIREALRELLADMARAELLGVASHARSQAATWADYEARVLDLVRGEPGARGCG